MKYAPQPYMAHVVRYSPGRFQIFKTIYAKRLYGSNFIVYFSTEHRMMQFEGSVHSPREHYTGMLLHEII